VIVKKVVDQYAHQCGVKDQLIAEREVVLTYALDALRNGGALDLLAFKGGTCLRKIVFGHTGRFSEDLDFTLRVEDAQDALTRLYEVFNGTHHGVTFSLDDWYETDDGFGMDVRYEHAWNSAAQFRLQVSKRETPTLPVVARPMVEQAYFKHLEFGVFDVPSLQTVEMAAEKIRAGFQRAKVRDLYDLHLLARQGLDTELLRRLVVLKLWQVADPFNADKFFGDLRGARYDWDDLARLVRPADRLEPKTVIEGIERAYADLRDLTDQELRVVDDARNGGHNGPLAEQLREEVRQRFNA
jgi:predicted nucleotidyltransferase component of viral defense system